jgi:hypothetical protein
MPSFNGIGQRVGYNQKHGRVKVWFWTNDVALHFTSPYVYFRLTFFVCRISPTIGVVFKFPRGFFTVNVIIKVVGGLGEREQD